MHTDFTRRLGLDHPIVQAPMGGANATPPALVSAVSNAGGLGFLGAAYMSPAQIAADSAAIRAMTSRPFGINLFIPTPIPELAANIEAELAPIARYHAELGLPEPTRPEMPAVTFDEQLTAVLESGAAVFSFTFGIISGVAMRALRNRGLYVMGTATTAEEARRLERAGVDAVIAQGSEAGAHRGTFAASFESSMVGTMALVPQVVDAVRIPVIASGGIMDGRGISAALTLGAAAVQMGTAFLTTDECGVAESYKEAVLAAHDDGTRVTRAFSGRPARGLVNRAMTEIEETGFLPYPFQNALTRPMRNAAAKQNKSEYLSMWAGQGAHLAKRSTATELMTRLVREMDRNQNRTR